jgi:hypothetical protein
MGENAYGARIMPDIEYDPVTSPEDEEDQRRKVYAYPPVSPPSSAGDSAPPLPSPQSLAIHPQYANIPDVIGGTKGGELGSSPPPRLAPQPMPRPQWKDYAPAESHGWGKLGHFAASLNPMTNRFFNQMPEQKAERNFNAATSDYDTNFNQNLATQKEGREQSAENAREEAAKQPKPKEEEWSVVPGMQGPNGEPVQQEKTSGLMRFSKDVSGVKPIKPPTEAHQNDFEQFYSDFLKDGNLPDSAHNRLMARKQFAQAGQAPQQPQRALMMVPQPDGSQKAVEVMPGMTVAGNAARPGEAASANRKDIAAHDKAYVQPAEAVEKSYQMMNNAFQEEEAARKAGKDLPTGAQSMVALSTHLSTTFGNVKGARITKDMIQEHLGARSIPDSALVAVQKLTNGDVLSPDQWKAFHDLISQSRKITWQQAAKEADRKHIPNDFLPQDLQNISHEPGQAGTKDLGAAPQGASEGRTGTMPDGTKVIVKGGRLVAQ